MPTMTIYVTSRGTPMADGSTSATGHMWFSLSEDGTNQHVPRMSAAICGVVRQDLGCRCRSPGLRSGGLAGAR